MKTLLEILGWLGKEPASGMDARRIYSEFGFESSTLPKSFQDTRVIDGIRFHVRPAGAKPGVRRAHRVFIECPDCGRLVPAGRMRQHARGTTHRAGGVIFRPTVAQCVDAINDGLCPHRDDTTRCLKPWGHAGACEYTRAVSQ